MHYFKFFIPWNRRQNGLGKLIEFCQWPNWIERLKKKYMDKNHNCRYIDIYYLYSLMLHLNEQENFRISFALYKSFKTYTYRATTLLTWYLNQKKNNERRRIWSKIQRSHSATLKTSERMWVGFLLHATFLFIWWENWNECVVNWWSNR